ncbi:MAG: FapA family protein [Gallionellaceae bacterium]|nr:FapA family protein [Gallionellaceae bacterium]
MPKQFIGWGLIPSKLEFFDMTQHANSANLPNYLIKENGGIYVELSLFPVGGGFEEYVDKLFNAGSRFRHVDYKLLMGLLYDYDSVLDAQGMKARVKLAEDIAAFSPLRKPLYKNVKIDAQGLFAEYFFEPVEISVIIEEPVYGEPDEDGVAPIISKTRKESVRPGKLDIDEFIADMWMKGVRFGIDIEAVSDVISRREAARMNIAVQLDPTEGTDAEIVEASEALRRDNSPKIMPNGKADLRKFQNRFPQIDLGERLLQKKPRVLGKPGYKVTGVLIEPEVPKDLDISALAGPGTRVERQEGFEYIVALRDGFLSLDIETNHISVTEKIENKGGVSIKTTGDLQLSGNEFIEHGEVQEGRGVEGKNMTFHADVYGNIVSQGGFILFESNLSGGSAKSIGGDVTANGRTFNSTVEAWDGHISIIYAESCMIFGDSIEIDRAVNCEIIGSDIEIQNAEGCSIAGKRVRVNSSTSCRGKDNMVSLLIPNLSATDAQIQQVILMLLECKKNIASKEANLSQIKSDPDVSRYLTLVTSVKQGLVKLNAVQENNFYQMAAKFTKVTSVVTKLEDERQELLKKVHAFKQELTYLIEVRNKQGANIHCVIPEVVGDTQVRTMSSPTGTSLFQKMKPADIKATLREQGQPKERIFHDDSGSVDWHYAMPEIEIPQD